MYICNRCGHLVDEVPTERWRHTELDGPFYEEEDAPCTCGGEFVEAHECECCGEYEAENELNNGWCRSCVAELAAAHELDPKKHAMEIYELIEDEREAGGS